MKKFPSLLLTILISMKLTAANTQEYFNNPPVENGVAPITFTLWEEKSPVNTNGLDTVSEHYDGVNWVENISEPQLYVYPAPQPNGMILLMCPGGGYAGVAINHEGNDLAPLLNENGVSLAVLKYRMPNGNPRVPAEDVARALELIHQNASKWGVDSNKIGIGGASAGGHLATTVATHSPGFAFQVLLYPVVSMKKDVTHQGSRVGLLGDNPSEDMVNYYSNETQVTADTPPAFIAVSADDKGVPVKNSLDYFIALNELDIPAALHVYPNGGHGWGTRTYFKYNKEWKNELVEWLKNQNDILNNKR